MQLKLRGLEFYVKDSWDGNAMEMPEVKMQATKFTKFPRL